MFHSMKDAMCMLLVYTNHIIVLTISNFVRNVFLSPVLTFLLQELNFDRLPTVS